MTRALQIPADTRQLIYARDQWSCLRCSRNLEGRTYSIHHRFPRRMGGTRDPRINDVRNLVLLCGTGNSGCHGWVEANRLTATGLGWLLHALDDYALDTPVVDLAGREVRLLLGARKVCLHPTLGEEQAE